MDKKKLKIASLFSGCGGMDLGAIGGFKFNGKTYARNNVEIAYATDFDKRVAAIYDLNFGHGADVRDIANLQPSEIPAIDIILGGFPCQSFSVVAQNPKRLGYKDAKGKLFFEMKRIIQQKQPKAFVAENVKGIISANHGEALPLIISEFEAAGYFVKYQVLNAAHFGVPQKRERVFIVGFKSRVAYENFEFPVATTQDQPVPIRNFLISDRKELENYFFSEKAVEGLRKTKNSKSMNKGRIQSLDGPSNTLGAHLAKVSLNSTDPVLWDGDRYRMFTPREVARLQSFPEKFKLAQAKSHNYLALGNAVPPVLMWHVMRQTLAALEA